MSSLYTPEHLSCLNYDNGAKPAAEMITLPKGQTIDVTVNQVVIAFVMKGYIHLRYEDVHGRELIQGQIMLFPAGINVNITSRNDAEIFVMRIRKRIRLCDKLPLEKLFVQTQQARKEHNHLLINEKVQQYLEHFTACIGDGLRCSQYFDLKTSELFFLLRGYYTKEELAAFFHPLLSTDALFTDFVWQNYRKVRSVKELADMSKYGLSTFKAKFRKVFGIPAMQWMNEQKMRNIYHELNCTTKSLKQITADNHFSSVSHLVLFCRKKLGATPGQIRRIEEQNGEQ